MVFHKFPYLNPYIFCKEKTTILGGGCNSLNGKLETDSGKSITSEKHEDLSESKEANYKKDTNNKVSEDVCETIQEPSLEEYAKITENGFIATNKNDTSTFSADVDTTSYSNIRRMITNGCSLDEIPSDAVRIEEMLNYFTYNYEKPKKESHLVFPCSVQNVLEIRKIILL